MGSNILLIGLHRFILVMVTGQVKFLKYIAGHMIMVKMEENLFLKQSRLEKVKAITKQ